jgi:hypothetical protein
MNSDVKLIVKYHKGTWFPLELSQPKAQERIKCDIYVQFFTKGIIFIKGIDYI